jgi:Ni,Fe-hydrogenase I large subunit
MAHIVVDPVTRIEGHLRIEAELNDGAVSERVEFGNHVSRD